MRGNQDYDSWKITITFVNTIGNINILRNMISKNFDTLNFCSTKPIPTFILKYTISLAPFEFHIIYGRSPINHQFIFLSNNFHGTFKSFKLKIGTKACKYFDRKNNLQMIIGRTKIVPKIEPQPKLKTDKKNWKDTFRHQIS